MLLYLQSCRRVLVIDRWILGCAQSRTLGRFGRFNGVHNIRAVHISGVGIRRRNVSDDCTLSPLLRCFYSLERLQIVLRTVTKQMCYLRVFTSGDKSFEFPLKLDLVLFDVFVFLACVATALSVEGKIHSITVKPSKLMASKLRFKIEFKRTK